MDQVLGDERMYVKVNGTWVTPNAIYVKVNGDWLLIKDLFVKTGEVWSKEV
mgnify:CR=1 FL=1